MTQQRRFTKEFAEEAVRLVQTSGRSARRSNATPGYRNAPDGDVTARGSKMWILHGPVVQYRDAAEKMLRSDPNVRAALNGGTAAGLSGLCGRRGVALRPLR